MTLKEKIVKKIVALFLVQVVTLNLYAITIGVVPQQSPLKLLQVWTPIVKYLQKTTGEDVVLKIEQSIPMFEKVLYAGGYDIAYMNPYHYIVAHDKAGYTAQVRASKNIVGILLANKKEGINDISKIKGKSFLFPAPHAFAATLLTKYELLNNYGINVDADKNFRYVNSHDSVYKGVARGIGDIGGGVERTYNNFNDIKSKRLLKIIYRTKAYPSHPFAYKDSMSKIEKEKFTKAFLNMPKELLKTLSMKKIIRTNDKEYDVIRNLSKKLSLSKD